MVRERTAWFILHETGCQNDALVNAIEGYRTGSSIVGTIACSIIIACIGFDIWTRPMVTTLMLACSLTCMLILNITRNIAVGIYPVAGINYISVQYAIDVVVESRLESLKHNLMISDRTRVLWNLTTVLFGIGLVLFVTGMIT